MKGAAEHRRYVQFVAETIDADGRCEVGPRIGLLDPSWRSCTGRADGLHHVRKRGQQGALMDPANTLRSCNPCNGYVEDHPDTAKAAGLQAINGETITVCHACSVGYRREPLHVGVPIIACPMVPRDLLVIATGGPCPMLTARGDG